MSGGPFQIGSGESVVPGDDVFVLRDIRSGIIRRRVVGGLWSSRTGCYLIECALTGDKHDAVYENALRCHATLLSARRSYIARLRRSIELHHASIARDQRKIERIESEIAADAAQRQEGAGR